MTRLNNMFKCSVCSSVVEVVQVGGGQLVCCGKPMVKLTENTFDAAEEKHVPIIEIDGTRVSVMVGKVPHPMEEKHYINRIEILKDNMIIATCQLGPTDKPAAEFVLDSTDNISARALCNLHGLWSS